MMWLQSFLHPAVPLKLLIIIIYLSLIAIGNLFGVYDSFIQHNPGQAAECAVAALLYLLPVYGLSKLKPWGRLLELIIALALTALGILLLIVGTYFMGLSIIIIHGLIAFYLLSKECKTAFGL